MVCPVCITTAILSQTPAITAALGIGGIAKVASETIKAPVANSNSAILPGQVVDCCAGKDTKKALPRKMIPKYSSMATKAEVKACCKKPSPGALSATRRP